MTDALDRAPSRAVDRALTILEELASAAEPMTLTRLSRVTGVPMATCAAILHTLEQRGYAARQVVGRSHFWRATLKVNGLAVQVMRKVDLADIAQPYLERLVEQEGFAAHIGILDGKDVVYVAKVASRGMVQFNTYQGKTSPYHLTALGRAIAAFLPADQVEPLLHGLEPGGGPGAKPTDPDSMRELLERTRKQGYALEDEEEERGIGCLAAPLFGTQGQVVGSIGVTAFATQFHGRRLPPIRDLVRTQAEQLSAALS